MKLVDITPDLLLEICSNLREQDAAEIAATSFDETPESMAARFMPAAEGGWIALSDGTPVAAGGAHCIWPNVWQLWLIGTDRFHECKLGMTRFAKKVMIPTLIQQGARRGQCLTLSTHVESHKWLETLGATREATLKNYGKNGEMFFCYSWDWT